MTAVPAKSRFHVPDTVSPAWQAVLRTYGDPSVAPAFPAPGDVEGWRRVQQACEDANLGPSEQTVARFEASVESLSLAGVPVLDIRPKGWRDDGRLLVYVHGGAYVLFSARSTLNGSVVAAHATGLRVLSVDYTLAPHARWRDVTGEVVAVLDELERQGQALEKIAMCGESAGGGLAAGAVLKRRDAGRSIPGAMVLWSPWTDITETGDTYVTLRDQEPYYTYERHLGPAADAYADRTDQKVPYVSPVYGDFTRGFPPTLVQGGTKEIFLSNFVRLYQALDTAGQTVKLDLYEGMPHVFPTNLPDSPESSAALAKMARFLAQHLR